MTQRPLYTGPLFVLAVLCIVALVFWPTFHDMLAIGIPGDEYTHRILAVPVFVVIVWRLRFELSSLPIRVFWPGFIGLACAGVVWLAGELTYTRLLTEIAIVAMIPISVLTVFGYRWLWALSFPLFYLSFAVPIRGPLVDIQVDLTARFAYWALLASGVPVHREGPYFELASGNWAIAEACSGIEYLSACLMLTVLYAWTMYRSTRKRIVFVAGAIAIGVCGNWLRAFLTIWIAHLSGNRFLRNGHGTFGWLVFAALLFFYCWVGWYFRDKDTSAATADVSANKVEDIGQKVVGFRVMPMSLAAGVSVVILVVWRFTAFVLAHNQSAALTEIVDISPVASWSQAAPLANGWTPTLVNPSRTRTQSFEKNGRRVNVFIGVFADQTWSSKLVTSVNHFVGSENNRWTLVKRNAFAAAYLDKILTVKTGVVLGDGTRILAWQWYWIHGVSTSSDIGAKTQQLRARLSGLEDISAWVVVSTPIDSSQEDSASVLSMFARDMGLSLEKALVDTSRR